MNNGQEYFQYMQGKAHSVTLDAKPGDVVEFKPSPEVAGAYFSNSGIEVRPATPEEAKLWELLWSKQA